MPKTRKMNEKKEQRIKKRQCIMKQHKKERKRMDERNTEEENWMR